MSSESQSAPLINSLVDVGKYLMNRELAWGNSGNLSARIDEHRMLITASGSYMGSLTAEDLVVVEIQTGNWSGARKPSKEIPMHAAIYKKRPDVNVVLHASPFWSTLVACSGFPLRSELFIESMYYLEKIAYVDYHHPGSQALGTAVEEKAEQANIMFLKNHGVLVYDESFQEARMRLETLEMVCRMMIAARSANIELHFLDEQIVQDFLLNSGYKPVKK
ncbi:class II aldolase/adducin family protein [Brevibacillus marinus]|uniref:class II aldolase/adducin family protein n=1 Tax=Brevibacillus marinus TaxID=2496837 RepID=UPI000F848657|nr:class II aldolase/adducin family protein [Brevibacillus marinus]